MQFNSLAIRDTSIAFTLIFSSFFTARHCFDTIPVLAYKIQHRMQELTAGQDHEDENLIGPRRQKRAFTDVYGNPLTLYLVIDQSGSISESDFNNAILFMKELTNRVSSSKICDLNYV